MRGGVQVTAAGALVLGVYSLFAVIFLIIKDLKNFNRGGSKGWTIIVLMPVVIFLINSI